MKKSDYPLPKGYGHRTPPRFYKELFMRMACILVILTTAIVVGFAEKGSAQRVSIHRTDATLKSVIADLRAQTGYGILIEKELLTSAPRVTVDRTDADFRDVLDGLTRQLGYTYAIEEKEKFIVIEQKEAPLPNPPRRAEPESPKTVETFTIIRGTVKDEQGNPIVGASVSVKNTTIATMTQANGFYSIAANPDEVLVFSSMGYKRLEVLVDSRAVIDVVLEQDVAALNEVVVSGGYYITTDRLKTGSIVKVESKDIERQPVTNPLMALQGRVAGLEITPTNGSPGNSIKIRIRGENSLRANGGFPLYIIDGVQLEPRPLRSGGGWLLGPFDPLSTINPSNIESIEVLKDADATAIYGSKGANGVILITTKTAKAGEGKTTVDVGFYRGLGRVANKLDLLNTDQYLMMREEAFANDGATPDENTAPDLVLWDRNRYTDWQKVLIGGTANITDFNGTIVGGTMNTSFRLGGGYHKETQVFPGDFAYQRATTSFNLNHGSNDQKFRATLAVNYGVDKNNTSNDANLVNAALGLAPNAPALYDDNGELNWEMNSSVKQSWINPLSALEKAHDVITNNLVANTVLSYELVRGLVIKSSLGFTDLRNKELIKLPFTSMTPADRITGLPENTFGNNNRQSWIVEPQLNYTKKINNHDFNLIIGSTWQRSTSEYQSIRAEGYTSDALLGALQWAARSRVSAEGIDEYKYNSVFARLGYNYADKYLLNLTARRDGSSRFGPNNRFGNFGAVGAAWIFSNETFISEGLPWLSIGKIRGSYGVTGNDQIGDYQYYNYYVKTGGDYDGQIGINPSALFNANYQWERTKKLELALELGFINNRISFESVYYRNDSDNQLVSYPLPSTTGFPGILANLDATVQNSGFEMVINTQNIIKDDFTWNTSINFTLPRNKLVRFDKIEDTSYGQVYKVGEPLSIQRLFAWKGVNPQTGLHDFEDTNGSGSIENGDRKFMMPLDRKYGGGMINTFHYRVFEMSVLFEFSRAFSETFMGIDAPGSSSNQPVKVLGRWQKDGDVSNVQRFTQDITSNTYNIARNSSMRYVDGSYLRLKTLSFSYILPAGFVSKARLQDARMYLQGQNLVTFTDFETLDPQTGSGLPPLKMLSLGIQVKL